jgi:hypothetical protein
VDKRKKGRNYSSTKGRKCNVDKRENLTSTNGEIVYKVRKSSSKKGGKCVGRQNKENLIRSGRKMVSTKGGKSCLQKEENLVNLIHIRRKMFVYVRRKM